MKVTKVLKSVIALALAFGVVIGTHSTASADPFPYHPGDKIYIPGLGCIMLLDFPTLQATNRYIPWVRIGDSCDTGLGSVRGNAFIDTNENGKRDADEPIFGEAWYKITDGGAWFTCGYVGTDATFGVPVNGGTYYVLPVAPKGYRTTTPRVTVTVESEKASLNADIGFVADAAAPGDACDQYNPPR